MRVLTQIILLSVFSSVSVAATKLTDCNDLFGGRLPGLNSTAEAVNELWESLPVIVPQSKLATLDFYRLMTNFALPGLRLKTKLLVVGLVGASNTGKSTLFNALPSLIQRNKTLLLKDPISRADVTPTLTKRMVIATSGEDPDHTLIADLLERYQQLEAWQSSEDAGDPGPGNGLLVQIPTIPPHLAFVDAPDFDSGSVDKDEPDNLENALNVICPADALIVISTPETIRNQTNVKMLLNIFRSYGFKKTILVLRSFPKTPQSQANAMLIELANSLYDTRGHQYPEGVLGAYLMPYSFEVASGEEHPELIPLNTKTLPFYDLVEHLNAESYQIKEFSLRNAVDTITVQAERLAKEHLKSQLAMGLYKQAVKSLTETAAREALQDFPYPVWRDKIRKWFLASSSTFSRKVYPVASFVSFPERYIPLLNKLLQQYGRQDNGTETVLRDDHRLHDKMAVTTLTLQLHNRLLTFDRVGMTPAIRTLVDLAESYYKLFPEELDPLEEKGAESKVRIRLPKTSLLAPEAQKALKNLLQADTDMLMTELGQRLDRRQLDYHNKAEPDPEILQALEDRPPSWIQRASANTLSAVTVGFAAAPLVTSTYLGMGDNMILNLLLVAAGCPLARPWHKRNEENLDRYLRNKLDEWFHDLQSSVTSLFFDEITSPLMNALAKENVEKEEALRRIQNALTYLNPNYNKLPLSLYELRTVE